VIVFSQGSIGIDIKNDGIAVAYVKTSLRGIRLAKHEFYALEKERPLKENLGRVREWASDFMRENRVNGSTPVFLGIPGELTIFKTIEFPLAVKENLRSTLRYEMEKHVPLSADEVLFDYHLLSEDKGKNRLKVLLMIGKKAELSPYLDFSGTLGSGISGIETCSTALVNAFAYHSGKRGAVSEETIIGILKGGAHSQPLSDPKFGIKKDIATGFGLALKGVWNAPVQINFLPSELRRKPGKAGYYVMLFLTVMLILSGLAWGGTYFMKQRLAAKSLDAELSRLRSEIANIDRIRSDSEALRERLDYLSATRSGHASALEILRELTQTIPETAWVRELTVSEKEVQLSGYADAASGLIPLLEDSPLFKDVVFLSTITKDKDGKEYFRIGLKLIEN
jgi:Tfp pilus assembly protein PilN